MKTYLVGGAVRDALLGQPGSDRDYVVVGATPQEMLAQGFTPVGKDFPVFLHPQTKCEYALARTERKSGKGYKGFEVYASPEVTLEEDLLRRDLTINAIALPIELADHPIQEADCIDPHGGIADLKARVLRHVSPAFAEDPLRILRVARFAARFPDFTIATETVAMMREMVEAGEVQHLVAERVWQEISRGLMTARPSRMFEALRACGALRVILPELDRLWGVPQRPEYHPEVDTGVHAMMVLDMAAQLNAPLTVRYACLCHDFGKGTTPPDLLPRHIGHEERSARLAKALAERWRVPVDCKELADVVAREHGNIHRSGDLNAAATVRLIERCDGYRRPERFEEVLLACEADARGRTGFETSAYPQRARLSAALQASLHAHKGLDFSTIPDDKRKGERISALIRHARESAIATALSAQ